MDLATTFRIAMVSVKPLFMDKASQMTVKPRPPYLTASIKLGMKY